MSVMGITNRRLSCIDRIRCPAIKGLSPDIVHMLHHSLVGLVHLQRSIEDAKLQVGLSWRAAYESEDMLRQLRERGF